MTVSSTCPYGVCRVECTVVARYLLLFLIGNIRCTRENTPSINSAQRDCIPELSE